MTVTIAATSPRDACAPAAGVNAASIDQRDSPVPVPVLVPVTLPVANPAPVDPPKFSLNVVVPDAAAAEDAALVSAIAGLANRVFGKAEVVIWNEGFARTTADEVAEMLRVGQLVLGYLDVKTGTAPLARPSADADADELLVYTNAEGQQLVGCICVKQQSPTTGFVSMLALDRRYQGLGLARDLMAFAEKRCLDLGYSAVGLDLLYPTSFVHPHKARMQAWYQRLGYEIIRLSKFEDEYPDHAPLLAATAELRVFEKRLC